MPFSSLPSFVSFYQTLWYAGIQFDGNGEMDLCVRQASIRKLVQQILVKKNLNSLPEGFWNDNQKFLK